MKGPGGWALKRLSGFVPKATLFLPRIGRDTDAEAGGFEGEMSPLRRVTLDGRLTLDLPEAAGRLGSVSPSRRSGWREAGTLGSPRI